MFICSVILLFITILLLVGSLPLNAISHCYSWMWPGKKSCQTLAYTTAKHQHSMQIVMYPDYLCNR
jgi:hypothetical protein